MLHLTNIFKNGFFIHISLFLLIEDPEYRGGGLLRRPI